MGIDAKLLREMEEILRKLKDPKNKVDTSPLDTLIKEGKALMGDKDNPY